MSIFLRVHDTNLLDTYNSKTIRYWSYITFTCVAVYITKRKPTYIHLCFRSIQNIHLYRTILFHSKSSEEILEGHVRELKGQLRTRDELIDRLRDDIRRLEHTRDQTDFKVCVQSAMGQECPHAILYLYLYRPNTQVLSQ